MDVETASIEPIRFDVTVEPAESRRFAAHTLLQTPLVRHLAYGGTLFVLAAVLAGRDVRSGDAAHGTFEAVLALATAAYLVRLVRGTYARLVERGLRPVTYTFSEDGVACEGAHAAWSIPWRSVGGYLRRPDGYYFNFGSSHVPLPLRALPPERASDFVSLVLRRGRRFVRTKRL